MAVREPARMAARALAVCSLFVLGAPAPALVSEAAAHGGAHPRPDKIVRPEASLQALLRESELVDQSGAPLSIADLAGRPLLVSFMFTKCVDLCPTQTAGLKRLRRALAATGADRDLQLLSISLAPATDTPGTLRAYAARYRIEGERWRFATGEPSVVDELASAFWIDADPNLDGRIDHRMIVHLLDSNLQPVQRYRTDPIDVEYLTREILSLQAVERRGL